MEINQVLRSRGEGMGILVSKVPKETQASYTLQDPSEASNFVQMFDYIPISLNLRN